MIDTEGQRIALTLPPWSTPRRRGRGLRSRLSLFLAPPAVGTRRRPGQTSIHATVQHQPTPAHPCLPRQAPLAPGLSPGRPPSSHLLSCSFLSLALSLSCYRSLALARDTGVPVQSRDRYHGSDMLANDAADRVAHVHGSDEREDELRNAKGTTLLVCGLG